VVLREGPYDASPCGLLVDNGQWSSSIALSASARPTDGAPQRHWHGRILEGVGDNQRTTCVVRLLVAMVVCMRFPLMIAMVLLAHSTTPDWWHLSLRCC
jgi:hypothetical protein